MKSPTLSRWRSRTRTALLADFRSAWVQAPRRKHCCSVPFDVRKQARKHHARKNKRSGNSASGQPTPATVLPFQRHEPPRKLFFHVRGKIHAEIRTRVQTQRIAVCAVKQQLNRPPAG